jgi:hypothetical protein
MKPYFMYEDKCPTILKMFLKILNLSSGFYLCRMFYTHEQ